MRARKPPVAADWSIVLVDVLLWIGYNPYKAAAHPITPNRPK